MAVFLSETLVSVFLSFPASRSCLPSLTHSFLLSSSNQASAGWPLLTSCLSSFFFCLMALAHQVKVFHIYGLTLIIGIISILKLLLITCTLNHYCKIHFTMYSNIHWTWQSEHGHLWAIILIITFCLLYPQNICSST